jgi:hypothetical protein
MLYPLPVPFADNFQHCIYAARPNPGKCSYGKILPLALVDAPDNNQSNLPGTPPTTSATGTKRKDLSEALPG